MDRRQFIRAAAVGAAVVSTGNLAGCGGGGDDAAPGTGPDLLLVNGDIHTLDDQDRTISSIGIRDGRFVPEADINRSRALVIDLRGKTVVPGLIESHTHFISLANRPGYHVADWELASDIAGVLWVLRTHASWRALPAEYGPWRTVYGRHRTRVASGLWPRILGALYDAQTPTN